MKLKRLDYVMPGIYLIILLIVLGSFLVLAPWKKSGNMAVPTSTSTCTTTTTTTATTTATTTTVTICTTTVTTTTTTVTTVYDFKERLIDYGYFVGTYYHSEIVNPCKGGSGRMLIDCTPKLDEIKGSVACRRVQEDYGYDINGRTRVWLEVTKYPNMTGWYFLDDACRDYDVVDVYFIEYSDCPWEHDGKTEVHLWLEPS